MTSNNKHTTTPNPEPGAPKDSEAGTGIALGISIGMSLGVALGLVTKNLALGLSLGIALGAGIGVVFEETKKRRSKPKD